MSDVLTADALTPDRVTALLRERGHLGGGRVEQVIIESSRTTLLSTVARVRLEWSPDADARSLPSRLFFKTSRPDRSPELAAGGLKEATFYSTVG